MLPALAERCRTWTHKSTCEYQKLNGGAAPLSTEEGQTPLCSCGQGTVSAAQLAKLAGVKEWGPFAKYAIRVAIAPIFPVPYVESSLSDVLDPSPAAPSRPGGLLQALQRKKAAGNSTLTSSSSSGRPPVDDVPRCDFCGKKDGPDGGGGKGLLVCGRCKRARYCGAACQRAAWKGHKGDCGRG